MTEQPEKSNVQPTPAERAEAWDREEPWELRLAADEWDALGADIYAHYLRRWADFREGLSEAPPPGFMRPPTVRPK